MGWHAVGAGAGEGGGRGKCTGGGGNGESIQRLDGAVRGAGDGHGNEPGDDGVEGEVEAGDVAECGGERLIDEAISCGQRKKQNVNIHQSLDLVDSSVVNCSAICI